MNPKLVPNLIIALVAAVAILSAACNRSPVRTDAQVASEVQSKINADQNVRNKQIAVLAANGVITLSGPVGSEAERSAAAGDAANVSGVRTVVNNLSVQSTEASTAQSAPPADTAQQAVPAQSQPPAQQSADTARAHKPSATGQKNTRQPSSSGAMTQAEAMAQQRNQPAQDALNNSPANAPAPTPAPPPPPAEITVPDGTVLAVRMLDTLDSETTNSGDTFRATLNSPVQADSRIVIPADADLFGRVVDVHAAGRFKGAALMTIEITKVSFNGRSYPIHTDQWSKQTQGRGTNTAAKVGGGAAIGGLLGGILGGGKGAGVGAAVGAGAGGATQAATRAAQIKLGPETLLTFHLTQPVVVRPAESNDRNAGRQRME